jgi:hypothetical protein
MPTLARVIFPNKNGLAVDGVTNDFAFDVDATDSAQQVAIDTAITGFFDGNKAITSQNTIVHIADCIDLTKVMVQLYDLTGHLGGTPLGSPVAVTTPSWARLATLGGPHSGGSQLAACCVFHSAYDVPEVGATASIPTSESAQDEGAPATHTGITRPRARERGRVYIGPLAAGSTSSVDANGNPSLIATCLDTLTAACTDLMAAPVSWSVWSRRDSTLRHVTHGWVDHGIKTQRRRTYKPNLRESF